MEDGRSAAEQRSISKIPPPREMVQNRFKTGSKQVQNRFKTGSKQVQNRFKTGSKQQNKGFLSVSFYER
jgi:hypothetical protein